MELLAPAMFVCLVAALFVGFPVAFSLAAIAGVFGLIGVVTGRFEASFLSAIFFRVQGLFNNDNLLALPMLVFMGLLLERTGIAEGMFISLNRLFGRVPGGLAYTTVIVGAVLSGITGFVSASVIAIGLIALPVMLRSGYDHRLASGVVAATGTLAQVIPPSLVLIVLAEQMDVSVTDLYRGALVPSLLLIGAYLAYVFVLTQMSPDTAPPDRSLSTGRAIGPLVGQALIAAGLPLGLVIVVLATIYLGVATPTEGGAIGVTGTLLLGLLRSRLTLEKLHQAMVATGILVSGLMFLLMGASFFTLVFRGLDGQRWIQALFSHIPAGEIGFVIFVSLSVFLIAFVLDFFEIAFIVLPLIVPVAQHLGVDMIWLTILLAVNLQTSFMHPPFGIAIYNLRSITPSTVRTVDIYWGAVPFLCIQLVMVGLLILVPQLVLKPPPPASVSPRDINIIIPPFLETPGSVSPWK
ncbi:MAG: TRAP transporter large permease subunit [Rhizobiales bacterium]|nr:TRAP transporter large permease subunit [Hyphomicrobiales bacterium]